MLFSNSNVGRLYDPPIRSHNVKYCPSYVTRITCGAIFASTVIVIEFQVMDSMMRTTINPRMRNNINPRIVMLVSK